MQKGRCSAELRKLCNTVSPNIVSVVKLKRPEPTENRKSMSAKYTARLWTSGI
jgi:hypothetical protein